MGKGRTYKNQESGRETAELKVRTAGTRADLMEGGGRVKRKRRVGSFLCFQKILVGFYGDPATSTAGRSGNSGWPRCVLVSSGGGFYGILFAARFLLFFIASKLSMAPGRALFLPEAATGKIPPVASAFQCLIRCVVIQEFHRKEPVEHLRTMGTCYANGENMQYTSRKHRSWATKKYRAENHGNRSTRKPIQNGKPQEKEKKREKKRKAIENTGAQIDEGKRRNFSSQPGPNR